jgi:hypothetical protein
MEQSSFCLDCQQLRFNPCSAVKTERHGYHQTLFYKTKDQFPQLPILSSSAEKGCKLCGFLVQVIRKHVIESIKPNIPAMEVELAFLEMLLWTRRDENDRLPGYMTGQITVGNISESLRIDVQDHERRVF